MIDSVLVLSLHIHRELAILGDSFEVSWWAFNMVRLQNTTDIQRRSQLPC